MKVSMSDLVEAIEPISLLVGKSKTPKLANVKISSSNQGIFAEATNLETFVRIRIDEYPFATSDDLIEDKVIVNAKDLKDIIALYKNSQVTHVDISSQEDQAIFETDISSTFMLRNMDEDSFVDVNIPELELKYIAPTQALMSGIKRALKFTPSPDSPNHEMRNISLESESERILSVVGTDGFRFARISVYNGSGVLNHRISEESAKFLLKCSRLFDGKTVRILESEGKLHFKNNDSDKIHVFVPISNDEFPDWRRVIPSNEKFHVRFSTDEMTNRMKRLKAKTKGAFSTFIIDFEDGNIVFSSKDPFGSLKEVPEEFEIKKSNGAIKAAYNPDFFIDAINAVEENEFDLKIYKDYNIASIEGSDFYSLIMPVRLE